MSSRTGIRTAVLFAVMMLLTASFASCSIVKDLTGDAQEDLKLVYQGYGTNEGSLIKEDGTEVDCRSYCFIFENASDRDVKKAGVTVRGLDENGEAIYNEFGSSYVLPELHPGERAIVEVLDAEWTEAPASFRAEVSGVKWGESKGQSLTITGVNKAGGFACDVSIKNESDEECVWFDALSDQEDIENERVPFMIAVNKDGDGNVLNIDTAVPLDGNDQLRGNIVFAPGEEKEIPFALSDSDQEPEFMICWR